MSNETQWTPGPWMTPPMPRCGGDLGIMTSPANGKCQVVAMVVVDEDYPQEDAEQCANARLIAAAPEMAALLERLLAHYEWGRLRYPDDEHGIVAPDIREMRALVTKIKKGA